MNPKDFRFENVQAFECKEASFVRDAQEAIYATLKRDEARHRFHMIGIAIVAVIGLLLIVGSLCYTRGYLDAHNEIQALLQERPQP